MAMISVLIPVYNYDVIELVKMVHKQLELCSIAYEIKCLDDASEIKFQKQKYEIDQFANSSYEISKSNQGRIATRHHLAQSAKYDYLLFLDADVIPKSDEFIKIYLSFIDSKFNVIYGGVAYKKEKPEHDYLLRWSYGKLKEEVSAVKRNITPYKCIVSANFLIKKSIFITLNSCITYSGYGSDNHFSYELIKNNILVLHIDNYVYHLGIEKSTTYLKKKEEAATALIELYRTKPTIEHNNHLLRLFTKLKHYKLNYPAAFIFKIVRPLLRKNLLGSNPSVMYLQFYRIGYMCSKDLNN